MIQTGERKKKERRNKKQQIYIRQTNRANK